MNAFIKTKNGLYKIYRNGLNWQLINPDNTERWFSVWQKDLKNSLFRVVHNIPDASESDLVIVKFD